MKELINLYNTCPICGKQYTGHPALSRLDNSTLICSDCGTRQALESIFRLPVPRLKAAHVAPVPGLQCNRLLHSISHTYLCSVLSDNDLIMYLFRGKMGLVSTFGLVSNTQLFLYNFV